MAGIQEPLASLGMEIPQRGLILDAGAGTGTNAARLSGPERTIICLDIKPPKTGSCGEIPFVIGSIDHLPFKENAFDFVYCLSVIQLLENDKTCLSEFGRVLKKGGAFFFTVPTWLSVFHILRELEISCRVYPYPEYNVTHHHYYTKKRIRTLLEEGFSDAEIWGYQFNFFPRLVFFIMMLFTGSCYVKHHERKKPLQKNSRPDEHQFPRHPTVKPPGKKRRIFCRLFSDMAYHYIVLARKG